jgi:hypothetical protein
MLFNYSPLYKIAQSLQSLQTVGLLFKDSVHKDISKDESKRFVAVLEEVQQRCPEYGLNYTSDMAKRISEKSAPETYADLFSELDHLNGSLIYELNKESLFRIPSERKDYFERDDLFGAEVATAFPSCERDIRKAGSCYALEQEDACVHHLMLVLERGLNALAAKVGVQYQRTNWQTIIEQIASKLKSAPKGTERDFYIEVNAQFGFLKDAYRNHSEHARDDHYDMPKALSTLNHVTAFMQTLTKGGLSE